MAPKDTEPYLALKAWYAASISCSVRLGWHLRLGIRFELGASRKFPTPCELVGPGGSSECRSQTSRKLLRLSSPSKAAACSRLATSASAVPASSASHTRSANSWRPKSSPEPSCAVDTTPEPPAESFR